MSEEQQPSARAIEEGQWEKEKEKEKEKEQEKEGVVACVPQGIGPLPPVKHDQVVANRDLFFQTLNQFHFAVGSKYLVPTIGGKELDLHRLYVEVTARGGLSKVIKDRKWKEIIGIFNFPPTTTSASFSLRKYYVSLLKAFEQVYFFQAQGQFAATINARRKKQKERIRRDPDHPKPNRSGYNFFFAEQHARLKALHLDKDREISKMIGELWNKLNEEERVVYQDFGLKDKERYKREMQEYKGRLKGSHISEVSSQQVSEIWNSGDHRPKYHSPVGAELELTQ